MTEKWYDKTVQQTEKALNTDINSGLSLSEVRRRRNEDGPNDIYGNSFNSFKNYIAHILTDYTSIIMLITLLLAAVFDEAENLFIMIFIMVVYYISVIIAYEKSESTLKSVSDNILPTAKVIRDGRLFIVRQKDIVRGDVFYISTGDIIPCDARLIECNTLEVLETQVTGKEYGVRKNARFTDFHELPYGEQANMAFAGTIVTRGTGRAICCETGSDTAIRRIHKGKKPFHDESSEIISSVKAFCKKWTVGMTIWVLIMTVADVLIGISGKGVFDSFILCISSAVSSMSEFYVAFAYLSLACGIYFAVSRKDNINRGALVNYNSRLDSLRNLSCLIVPRTVGFCVTDVNIGFVYSNDDMFRPGDYGYKRNSARTIRYALLSTGIYGAENLIKSNSKHEDFHTPEEDCIINAARETGEYSISLESRYKMLEHISGDSETAFDTTLARYNNTNFVAVRGDFSKILPLCISYVDSKSRIYEMTNEKRISLSSVADELSRESYHIIAVASKDTQATNLLRPRELYCDLVFEGFIAVKETVIPGVAKNISRCRAAGIDVIMLCDNEDGSNYSLAESLGIATSPSQVINSNQIKSMRDEIFREDVKEYRVYVGLDTVQKRRLVSHLRENGEKVGYLCSELDEIILIRDADIGFSHRMTVPYGAGGSVELSEKKVALGAVNSYQTKASGCEALKFVSDVIVSDPDIKTSTGGFNAMVDAVLCAKGIYHNMHRMIKYMITSQVAKLCIVMFSAISPYTVCTPPQVMFWGLIIDFFALAVIAFEKPSYALLQSSVDAKKLKKPIISNLFSVATGVLLALTAAAVVYFMTKFGVISKSSISTCIFIIMILSQLTILSEYKHENGYFRGNVRVNGAHIIFVLFVILFIVSLFAFPSFGALFGIVTITPAAAVGICLVPVTVFAFCEIGKYVISTVKGGKDNI